MGIAEKALVLKRDFDEVYKAGASDFGLKGKGQGELVHFENVHPIEHKVEVGLGSKNLFNEAEANITKNEDYFSSNANYWESPCLTISVESGATYTATVEYHTPNTTDFNAIIAFSISTEKTYTTAAKSLMLRTKTENSTTSFTKTASTFTIPDGVEEIYFIANNDETYFKNVMVEKNSTATAYAPFIADFSDCKVKVIGANMFTTEGKEVLYPTVFPTPLETDKVYVGIARNGFVGNQSWLQYVDPTGCDVSDPRRMVLKCSQGAYGIGTAYLVKGGETYTINMANAEVNKNSVGFGFYKKDGTLISHLSRENFVFPFTTSVPDGAELMLLVLNGVKTLPYPEYEIFIFENVQLKRGTTATEYEPYTETEYTANADGTVKGVKSISPVMNILADKAGAVIDAECFLDPEAVITDLTNTVITLGGEI